MACGFSGNPDLFGIGIRIGYYTQITAVWFSSYIYLREAKVLRSVNNLFLLALIIVGFIFFFNAQSTYVIHAFLLLQIGIVVGLVGITETARYATRYRETSRERLVLRIIIMTFGALFNVFFWWKGLDIMLPTPCGTYAFYFYKAGFYGWLRTVMKAQSLFAATWTAPLHASRDAATLIYEYRMRETRASFIGALSAIEDVSKPHRVRDGKPKEERKRANLKWQLCASSQSQNRKPTILKKGSDNAKSSIINHPVFLKHKIKDTVTLDRAPDMGCPILAGVGKAQEYIELLSSIYPEDTALPGKRRTTRECLKLPIHRRQTRCSDVTPYIQCVSGALRSIWTNKPSMSLRNAMNLHFIALGATTLWKWPRIMNRMYELDKDSKTPDWHHFTIASDLHLSRITTTNSTAKWASAAALQFIFIALLIVQIEMTLVWNKVDGLQSLSSLGQLIPFTLGVGGLIKVLWGKACLVRRGNEVIEKGGEGPVRDYESAMARYLELKNGRPGSTIPRAATV